MISATLAVGTLGDVTSTTTATPIIVTATSASRMRQAAGVAKNGCSRPALNPNTANHTTLAAQAPAPKNHRRSDSSLARAPINTTVSGGAKGLQFVADADLEHWRWMWDTNVLGTLRVTRALLPKLIDSGDGLIVTVTSIAAIEVYDGGAGYTAAKHAQGALHRTLRGELLGKPVRLTEIAPGAVETEFSLVRFDGDQQRADAVYAGMTPLVAADVAEVIGFVATRPSHVNLDQIVIRPRDQASASRRATHPVR